MGYVYKITNLINGKMYVGKTEHLNPENRWKEHLSDYKKIKNEKRPLYDAMNKYGCENFYFEILDNTDDSDKLCELEKYYIDLYRTYIGFEDCNGYNATVGGEGKPYLGLNEDDVIKYHINEACYVVGRTGEHFNVDKMVIKKILKKHDITWISKSDFNKNKTMNVHGGVCQIDPDNFNIIKCYNTIYDAKLYFNKPKSSTITEACIGKRKSHMAYGFLWYYKDEYDKLTNI